MMHGQKILSTYVFITIIIIIIIINMLHKE
jgi:hypothetical protein